MKIFVVVVLQEGYSPELLGPFQSRDEAFSAAEGEKEFVGDECLTYVYMITEQGIQEVEE